MTLVKFKNLLTPSRMEPSIARVPFFSDLIDSHKSLFNLNRVFNGDSDITPAMNIKETKTEFEIEMAAPGLAKNDFKITIDDGVLTISSEKEEDYLRKEFSHATFTRSLSLPETVDYSKDVKAGYFDGVLKLVFTKNPE